MNTYQMSVVYLLWAIQIGGNGKKYLVGAYADKAKAEQYGHFLQETDDLSERTERYKYTVQERAVL